MQAGFYGEVVGAVWSWDGPYTAEHGEHLAVLWDSTNGSGSKTVDGDAGADEQASSEAATLTISMLDYAHEELEYRSVALPTFTSDTFSSFLRPLLEGPIW